MGRPTQCIAKCKKLDMLENNLFYDHIFTQQFICVARMGEKENELWLERNSQNISNNYYLWVVGF